MFNPQMLIQFKQFMSNPESFMSRMGIPKEMTNNPDAIIQHLMDTGKLSQEQYMSLKSQAGQIQSMLK